MTFNLDDPLAGILSDGSDDSFFDDEIIGKKSSAKPKITASAEKKQALFNLDAADEKPKTPAPLRKVEKNESFQDTYKGNTASALQRKAPSPAPIKRNISKESIIFTDADEKNNSNKVDIQSTKIKNIFGSNKSIKADQIESKQEFIKPLQKGKSSLSLIDDILGPETNKPISKHPSKVTLNTAKSQEESILGKSDTQQKTPVAPKETKVPKSTKSSKIDNVTNTAKAGDDWLGIFRDESEQNVKDDVGMPTWLIGADTKNKPNADIKKTEPQPDIKAEQNLVYNKNDENISSNTVKDNIATKVQANDAHKLSNANENVVAEGTALCLQEQESQLMIALQLKSQEERLAAIQSRHEESSKIQRESAKVSRDQVENLLRRQAEQRQQMQAVISAHQDRITERIKALLGPPLSNSEESNEEEVQRHAAFREAPHDKEKKQLLQLVQSLQENHDKEIDLMETSYRRQLAFLEISLNQAEERMKDEGDRIIKYYAEKITWLEKHHNLYKKLSEESIDALIERNKSENEVFRQQHLENVKILQEHHANLIENIRTAVRQEQVLIKDSSEYSSNLLELLADIKENKSSCQILVDTVQALVESSKRDSERNLESRDLQINDLMLQLKKDKENFESEKSENREIMKTLESRLKQMTMMVEEESATLRQRRMEFEFEKATFKKQTEFAKNVLKKQEEEIKAVRDEIDKECKDSKAQLEDEKAKAHRDGLAAAKEKSAVQNLKLELEKIKSELNVQLEEVSEERLKLNIEKQQIQMEHQRVIAKSRDLDLLAKAAIEKQSQADRKYTEAETVQRKYEERIRKIQEHVVSLNNREKQIAREKVALSRERLSLHSEKKQLEGLQCSLCKTSQNIPELPPAYTLPESFANIHVSRDYGSLDAVRRLTDIEAEVAQLVGIGMRPPEVTFDDLRHHGINNSEAFRSDPSSSLKDYVDPKLMLLRLDVQKVLSNLGHSKNNPEDPRDDDELEPE